MRGDSFDRVTEGDVIEKVHSEREGTSVSVECGAVYEGDA